MVGKQVSLLVNAAGVESWIVGEPEEESKASGAIRELEATAGTARPFPRSCHIGWTRTGTTLRAVVALQVVTERKQVERVKQAFVPNVSHELRTPAAAGP